MDLIGRNTVLWGLLILCVLGPSTAHAGSRIILNDGTVEESDRVWESEKYVHFILRGTQTVEIRYAKEIVARIEPLAPRHEIAGSPAKAGIPELSQDAIAPGSSQTLDKMSPPEEVASDSAALQSRSAPDPKIIASHRNVSFYDPQRTQRYWASHQSQHLSLAAALEALAKLYDRPTDWVVAHMGQE
ncbi:MAG: hypothetical protein KFF50_09125, partial [Desulfatitalea sp.]|nr:hypothetical protein [Desulfatitalea sp.]